MKAATIDRFSEPAQVHDVAVPALEDNAVLFRITAAGVNPIDWKTRDGESGKKRFPLTLGQDFAGVVERVGAGMTRVKKGDRIFGLAPGNGAYAEFSEVSDGGGSPFALIPDGISDEIAASLPTPVLTALASLEALGVKGGTDLLIVGAGGAVGTAAVQMAKARGAIITAFVKAGQEDEARSYGAQTVVTSTGNVIDTIASAHPDPFDAVFDMISDAGALKQAAALVKPGGAILTTIHVADEAWFAARNIRAINIAMQQTPQSSPQGLTTIANMVADGSLDVKAPEERPLAEANAVLDDLKAGKISGKVILRP